MKKRRCSLFPALLSVMLLSACGSGADKYTLPDALEGAAMDGQEASTEESEDNRKETGGRQMQKMTVEAGGQKFQAVLYDNEAVQVLLERLPLTLPMEELNGNEKFYYLDEELPADSENVGNMKAGDIMLFGTDCLVLFFEDFSTSYHYTKIGHIEEGETFADALPGETVEVTFDH